MSSGNTTPWISLKLPEEMLADSHIIDSSFAKPEVVIRYDKFVDKLIKKDSDEMMAAHIGLGITGEAGELADAIKREYIYGKARDLENIIEELGDILWYVQAAINHYGLDLQSIYQANADKLAKRYVSLQFSSVAAIERADKKPT